MTIRLRQLCFVAEKLAPVVEDLTSIFGLEVCFVDDGVGGFRPGELAVSGRLKLF